MEYHHYHHHHRHHHFPQLLSHLGIHLIIQACLQCMEHLITVYLPCMERHCPFNIMELFLPLPSYVPHETSYYGTPIHTPYDESSSHSFTNPFVLCFIKGNISVCFGCKNKYPKSPSPPYNICIRHTEWREYVPRGSEDKHTKYGNVYYHCRLYCICLCCPEFLHSQLDVSHVLENHTRTI